ncbi:class I SAM-dependent methyltransferase [Sediminibacterium sp. C3]|uniref:class I SAM-dependent methyltransferase n=1 Tax=Sediminibacterium sp. C3 TaxID=1267211 RepID=UPI00040B179C|nr:class I SAM-dependent methyltransferase [Sediminibacterium sp. C3]
MNKLAKKAGKQFFHQLGANQLLNELNFRFQQCRHYFGNRQFQKKHKRFVFPSDRALFNTFQLNYQRFYEDGLLSAKELIEWSGIKNQERPVILDWGTGTGRIIRHLPTLMSNAVCYGSDLDEALISWCKKNIDAVYFDTINNECLPYPSYYFTAIWGISVFTHIPAKETANWLAELHRIMKDNAIAILTTHGSNYYHQLNAAQLSQLNNQGTYTIDYIEKGHRLMTTYHEAESFRSMLRQRFQIEHFWKGKTHPEKMGGQDCWIIKKVPAA